MRDNACRRPWEYLAVRMSNVHHRFIHPSVIQTLVPGGYLMRSWHVTFLCEIKNSVCSVPIASRLPLSEYRLAFAAVNITCKTTSSWQFCHDSCSFSSWSSHASLHVLGCWPAKCTFLLLWKRECPLVRKHDHKYGPHLSRVGKRLF